jgi:hypothetical protein
LVSASSPAVAASLPGGVAGVGRVAARLVPGGVGDVVHTVDASGVDVRRRRRVIGHQSPERR